MISIKLRAFTLIELLIVVAIIAILAAIAVPNFLEAQVRAKVTRCKNDMRSLATALEAYRVDGNRYPMDSRGWVLPPPPKVAINIFKTPEGSEFFVLTTPIAYISSVPRNVYPNMSATYTGEDGQFHRGSFRYPYCAEDTLNAQTSELQAKAGGNKWIIYSMGPDMADSQGASYLYGLEYLLTRPPLLIPGWGIDVKAGALYDPTNGTVSNGDIARVGP